MVKWKSILISLISDLLHISSKAVSRLSKNDTRSGIPARVYPSGYSSRNKKRELRYPLGYTRSEIPQPISDGVYPMGYTPAGISSRALDKQYPIEYTRSNQHLPSRVSVDSHEILEVTDDFVYSQLRLET